MKVADIPRRLITLSTNPARVSCLRENLTSSSYGEGLETDQALAEEPRQSLTRQLDIRNLKTTLGMDVLRCLTPQMVEKELWVYLLAYNVIRLLMAEAACNADVHPRELSFKHTVQMWTEWTSTTLRQSPMQRTDFFRLIAQLTVGNRPGRLEPRARKRRPKPYQWLKVPREKARRQIRRHGYLPNPSA